MSGKIILLPRNTFLATWSAIVISTITAPGKKNPNMVPSGFLIMFLPAGLLIATATGTTLDLGAGLTLTMLLGVLLLSTTVAGITLADIGVGAQARSVAPFMGQRLLASSAAVSDLAWASVLASASAGFR